MRQVFCFKTFLYILILLVLDVCVLPYFTIGPAHPTLMYLLVIYVAFRWHWNLSIPMAMLAGFSYDLVGSQPLGVETVSLVLACYLLNLAVQKIERYFFLMRLLTAFLFVSLASLISVFLTFVLGDSVPSFWHVLAITFCRGLFSVFMLPLFFEVTKRWFRDKTYLRPKQYELFA